MAPKRVGENATTRMWCNIWCSGNGLEFWFTTLDKSPKVRENRIRGLYQYRMM